MAAEEGPRLADEWGVPFIESSAKYNTNVEEVFFFILFFYREQCQAQHQCGGDIRVCVRACVYACMHACVLACMRACMCMCVRARAYVRARNNKCVIECTHACVCVLVWLPVVCVRMGLCVYVRGDMGVYMCMLTWELSCCNE